jgi:hypothetical protein
VAHHAHRHKQSPMITVRETATVVQAGVTDSFCLSSRTSPRRDAVAVKPPNWISRQLQTAGSRPSAPRRTAFRLQSRPGDQRCCLVLRRVDRKKNRASRSHLHTRHRTSS